ncbi:MAG: hypothetical protein ACXV8J_08725, partial [Methylobacter sp.]
RARGAGLRAHPDAAFLLDFPDVVTAVEAGFRHAETLLELLGDASLHPRRADHAMIVCALHRTLAQIEGGDVALGRQVADALDAVLAMPWNAVGTHVPDHAVPPPHARVCRPPLHSTH